MSQRGYGFAAHRVYPRFAATLQYASRVPGGLGVASRLMSGIAFDRQPSATDDALPSISAGVPVAVCGFPRSGTTYLAWTVAALMEDDDLHARAPLVPKTHDVFMVRRWDQSGISVIVPVRDPADTAVSWCVYHQDEPTDISMRRRIDLWVAWHRHLLRRSPHVMLVDFTAMTEDPNLLARVLPPLLPGAPLDRDAILEAIDRDNEDAGIDVDMGNAPHPHRDNLKEQFRVLLASDGVGRSLRRARRLHGRLREALYLASTPGDRVDFTT